MAQDDARASDDKAATDASSASAVTHPRTPPRRPPALIVGAAPVRPHIPQTPPGSPMDVDFEAGRSPSASPSAMAERLSKKPVISVFDWDDTLCPSSWLYREGLLAGHGLVESHEVFALTSQVAAFNGAASKTSTRQADGPTTRTMNSQDAQVLRVLEDHVLALLRTARQFGPVFIITAAKLHWVRQCATAFLPNVLQLFSKSDTIHVISAREFYADQSRRMGTHQSKQAEEGTPLAWKTVAFEAVCAHLRVDEFVRRSRATTGKSSASVKVDFVSIGDSLCERDACRFLAMKAPGVLHSKTLKFLDQPKLPELLEQIKVTKALYDQVCRYEGNLDLHVVRSRGTLQVIQLDAAHAATVPGAIDHQGQSQPQVDHQRRTKTTAVATAASAVTAVTAAAVASAPATASSAARATVSGPLTSL
jgi:hypothetical protein